MEVLHLLLDLKHIDNGYKQNMKGLVAYTAKFYISIFLYFDEFHSSLSFMEAMNQTYQNQVHHFMIKKAI